MTMQNSKFKKEFILRLVNFSIDIIKFCELLKNEKYFLVIIDQLLRSATSIGANVIEAKSSSSKTEYLRYFQIALKSANETKYWLFIILKTTKDNKEKINQLLRETEEIANILAAGILTMKGKK
jgi:four helix bundle protein